MAYSGASFEVTLAVNAVEIRQQVSQVGSLCSHVYLAGFSQLVSTNPVIHHLSAFSISVCGSRKETEEDGTGQAR